MPKLAGARAIKKDMLLTAANNKQRENGAVIPTPFIKAKLMNPVTKNVIDVIKISVITSVVVSCVTPRFRDSKLEKRVLRYPSILFFNLYRHVNVMANKTDMPIASQ